jgi:phosphoribosylformimino-5-aminoimidazole carboxamide ribotide isomerase
MRIIPVIDLLDGQAVHAIRGNRQNYRPVRSVLCATSNPRTIATAFRDILGLHEIYIADLNSIQGSPLGSHRRLISDLSRSENLEIVLDAGITRAVDVAPWLDQGVHKVAVGTETLREFRALEELPATIDRKRLVISLDTRDGKVLSPCAELTEMSPLEALGCLQSLGWTEIIILDLSLVGSEEGINRTVVRNAHAKFPGLNLLVGGGLASPEQLAELSESGVSGVLAATALHRGIITARHISALKESPG